MYMLHVNVHVHVHVQEYVMCVSEYVCVHVLYYPHHS